MRRVTLTVLTGVSKIMAKVLIHNKNGMKFFDMYVLKNEETDVNLARIPISVTANLTLFVILVHIWYLKRVQKRPFISPKKSSKYGDIVNDIEIFSTRSFVWASLATVLRMGLSELLVNESEVVK